MLLALACISAGALLFAEIADQVVDGGSNRCREPCCCSDAYDQLVIDDGWNDDAAAAQKAMRNPIGDCDHFFGSLRMGQEAQRAGV